VLVLIVIPPLARAMFGVDGYVPPLALTLVNIFVTGCSFIPFHVRGIEPKAGQLTALSTVRSVATLWLRLALVVGLTMGVTGVALADTIVSALMTGACCHPGSPGAAGRRRRSTAAVAKIASVIRAGRCVSTC